MESSPIIHDSFVNLDQNYYHVKTCIREKLHQWIDLFEFNDHLDQIKFKTEGPLIPEENSKIPILILLSNPHPHSVKQGMFLSPNRIGRENPFWETLRNTGYFSHHLQITPRMMIKGLYQSPFRFFMAVLFPFPTEDPSHLKIFFGINEYRKMLLACKEATRTLIAAHAIHHVICFGQLQYAVITHSGSPRNYVSSLKEGKFIRDAAWFSKDVAVFLTYPTGWRFIKNHKTVKRDSLRMIFDTVLSDYTK
jgi:hypothetical protein